MPDTTPDLIEMERRVNELSAEVRRLRARERLVPTRGVGLALLLGIVLATVPLTIGAQGEQATEDLLKRLAALENRLARPLTVQGPFTVVDAGGTPIMRVNTTNGTPQVMVGDPAAGGVSMGVAGAGGAGYVVVRTAAGRNGVGVGTYDGSEMGVHVVGADGRTVQAKLVLDQSSHGWLAVGDPTAGGVSVGVGKSGGGFMLVRRPDAQMGIGLGQFEGRPMSIGVFGDNEKELVSLRTDKQGGTVRVMVPTGVAVAALLAGENGGGVALTGPRGGKSAVNLEVEPSGGKVRVYAADGGTAHAELTAETSGGAMTLYTNAGAPSALLQTGNGGAGRLEISRAGTIFVEAGVANGRGIVRAGPVVGGPPLGALGFADTIMGKVK